MIDLEVNEMREYFKLLNPDADFDSVYTFYYDETNNIKKFIVKEEDFNYAFHSNFVLGGVVYEGEKPNMANFFDGLGLQATVKEVKLRHIAVGEFQDCLKSKKLDTFLKRVIASPLYIHYSTLNILYYSVVDIVDSAIANSEVAKELGLGFALKLKSDLYKLCKLEIDSVIDLFYQYKYPNIKNEDIIPFIKSLTSLFEDYEDDFEFHFGLTTLRQILKESEKKGTLPFVQDEEDHLLLKDFSQSYLRPIYTFKNSNHVFDREDEIQNLLAAYRLLDGETPINSFSFEDSKTEPLIQVSDILVGLMGKLSTFINTHSPEEISAEMGAFTEIQFINLDNLLDLINKSEAKNKGFLHNVDSNEELEKLRLIFQSRGKL